MSLSDSYPIGSHGWFQVDMNFMKKIPPGAEASNVLVGEVDFLEKPIIAFVRLSPAVLITGLTEVPVPTRYHYQDLIHIIILFYSKHFIFSIFKNSVIMFYCAILSRLTVTD